MSAKRKLLISMLSIVFILIAVAATIAIVLALTQQNITTTLNIGYTVTDIDGSVSATYTIGGVTEYLEPIADAEHVSEDNRSLIFKTTDTEAAGNLMFPTGQISLTSTNDNVVIQYTYTNTGDRHYIASMSFEADLVCENMTVEYSIDGTTYSEDRYAVVVPANSTNKSYWIKISIEDKARNASFQGDFNWLLSGCDEQEDSYLSLTSLEFQGSNGSYSASIASEGSYVGELVFPSSVNGDPVTTIAQNTSLTQAQKNQVTSVYVPDSVTTIGEYALKGFSNLQSVTFEQNETGTASVASSTGLISIGTEGFSNCSSLYEIIIPNTVNNIGYRPLLSCTSLTKLQVAEGNTTYHSDGNCLIKTADKTIIAGCKTSIIPTGDSVTTIGGLAFGSCSTLTSIVIPDNITTLESSVFASCSGLRSVTIGTGLTTIADSAFCYSGLVSITIPNNITSISQNAFAWCSKLKTVTIPDSVTSISTFGFYSCSELTTVTIGSGLSTIDTSVFDSCSNLKNITLHTMNSNVLSAVKEVATASGEMNLTIGESVTAIPDFAFSSCVNLKQVDFLATSTITIGSYSFNGCTNLTTITAVSNSLTLSEGSFCICSSLTTLPSNITGFENFTFESCSSLTTITITGSHIGEACFSDCNSLTTAYFITTEGWIYYDTDYEDLLPLSAEDLANPTTAAEYLKTYSTYQWNIG